MSQDHPLLLSFYGDDFTGSTDAMEALAVSGLRTVLFLTPPSPEFLREKFSDVRCVGVAGTSRAMSPAEMDMHLAPVLDQLWALGAPITHYKVCSTFDSAPEVGSIGHVADLVRGRLARGKTLTVLAGAPPLRRYTVFGNHFAAAGDEIFRLDRHPTMSRHPVTPMHESDLRVHLSHQTQASIGLMPLPELAGDATTVDAKHAARLASKPDLLLYDVADESSMRAVGRLLWKQCVAAPHFAIGSSGVEYALGAHWRAEGLAPAERARFPAVTPVKQLLVVSGSASPMTATQIRWASENGFDCLRAPAAGLCRGTTADGAYRALFDGALSALSVRPERGGVFRFGPRRPEHRRHTRNTDRRCARPRRRHGPPAGHGTRPARARTAVAHRTASTGRGGRRHLQLRDAGAGPLRPRDVVRTHARRALVPRLFGRRALRRIGNRTEGRPDGPRGLLRHGTGRLSPIPWADRRCC